MSAAIMLLLSSGIGSAQPTASAAVRTATTVKADPRTGRLVRSVVTAPKISTPKVITPVEIPPPPEPPTSAAAGPDTDINAMVEQSARKNGVDPLLVHSVIKAESNYNPNAVSNKGAQGLMQLMPATARELGVKHPMDPKENIEGGVKYLKYLQTQFGDPALALAAYNAGEGAVRRYNWIPPYPETQDYVVKVARNYRELRGKQQPSTKTTTATVATAGPQKPVPPAAVTEAPTEPPPTPLQYYYDAQGRLTLRTVR
ncbi:MAG TPA: lytic transglycosylase domain-containing protein [Bryobacteraceae bacterium]